MSGGSYSFLDVNASIDGPGGAFALEGAADEGIDIEYSEDKNTMTSGAGGDVMHSLHAANTGTVMIRVLKTSAINAKLDALYRYQTTSSALHGQNTILVNNPTSGDAYNLTQVAFKKYSKNTYAKDGNIMEWGFDVGKVSPKLGAASAVY